MTWTLAIPYNIPSQNTRDSMHWRARHRDTKTCEMLVRLAAANVPRATGPRSVVVTSYRKQRCADHSNLVGGAKGMVDSLVRAGLLVDDRDQLARIAYEQETLARMTPDDVARFGRVPLTVLSITDTPKE